jgi:DNA-binding NarL/FixJ family response regulator
MYMPEKVNARILIADDQESARKVLSALIESCLGWNVCGQAENGLQAIEKAQELQPDLIVLDLSMPVMDGLAAARAIGETSPSIPVLIYTLYVSPELAAGAKKAGVRLIVDKAGTQEKLLTSMTTLLASSGFRAAGQNGGQQTGERTSPALNSAARLRVQ